MVTFVVKISGEIKRSGHTKEEQIMARHGENIRKRKDGRWEGRYQIYNKEKEKQVYSSVYGRTYDEVREKLTTKKNLIKNPPKTEVEKSEEQKDSILESIMLSNVAQDWLSDVKEKRKPSTYVKYQMIYRNYIEKIFHGISLCDLTDALIKESFPDTISESVHKSIYCVLRQILKFISKKYSINVLNLKKPDFNARNKPIRVLAKSEQKNLFAALRHETDIFKMAVLLCLFTGLRLGELCALKWADIDFENQLLVVNRTVQRLYSEGHRTKTILVETAPKSEFSRREIPLTAVATELLTSFYNNKEYVFGGDKPMEPRTLQYRFKKILREAGVSDKNFHILRHTFSTNCIEGGTDVKSLSEMLGHSDVQITLNRYVHPTMDTKRQYMDSLSKFYGQICGQQGRERPCICGERGGISQINKIYVK